MQYLYDKYWRHRCGLTAAVQTYRSKGAIRETCKAFGLRPTPLTSQRPNVGMGDTGLDAQTIKEAGIDPADPMMGQVLSIVDELIGFPRHLGQHVGGFVITRDRLDHLVPISNAAMDRRTVIEWDKDDIGALGILKVDVLALGMLTCIRRAFQFMHQHYGQDLTLATVPAEDPRTYAMICQADTLGVFQIESRAQMSMLPRLRPQRSTISLSRSRSCGRVRSRAAWSILSQAPHGTGAGKLSQC